MGGLSIDGLVTGLDTAGIIRQLLEVERAPANRLQSQKSSLQKIIDAYRELNTKFTSVRDAADDLTSAVDWQEKFAFSSDEAVVSAKVTGTPTSGSLTFDVTSLAATHTVISGSSFASTDTNIAGGNDFTINGVTITAADYGTGTMTEVVNAINNADAGVTANAVQTSPGQYRLQVTSKTGGADGAFTVDGAGFDTAMGGFGVVDQGADASITVGTGPGAYTVTSSTNTFADVMPGLSFTANALGKATVTVQADSEAIADKVEDLVTKMNDVVSYIATRSKYDADKNTKGLFVGKSLPIDLRNDLTNALIDPVSGSSLVGASVGIETDRNGKISFDREKFLEAYESDPAAVEAFFSANGAGTADDGIAERASVLAEAVTRLNTGRIANAISSQESRIDTIDDRLASWDIRLELRETALRRQFSNLETTLGRLQQQGQWLNGQLAGLLA